VSDPGTVLRKRTFPIPERIYRRLRRCLRWVSAQFYTLNVVQPRQNVGDSMSVAMAHGDGLGRGTQSCPETGCSGRFAAMVLRWNPHRSRRSCLRSLVTKASTSSFPLLTNITRWRPAKVITFLLFPDMLRQSISPRFVANVLANCGADPLRGALEESWCRPPEGD